MLATTSFDWAEPDYAAVFAERADRLARIRANPEIIPVLAAHYRAAPWDFIDDWGCTYDPRLAARGLPAVVPFKLFAKQREWCEWVVARWRAGDPGLTEKSRDMGVSWLSVALSCTLCLFHEGLAIGFGSRKEEYVDKLGSPKSLFWKGREFLKLLPPEFLFGWTPADAPHLRISFPGTSSVMTGEAGDNIGRGDRSAIYFVDESAFIERPMLIEASLSQTTDCRIDVSTPHGMANPFAQKRHTWPPERIFIFDWRDDPRKGEAWYARQQELLDPVTLAQEVDRNYSASVVGVVIPQEWVQSCIDAHVVLGFEPTGRRRASLDVADEGPDLNALCIARGVFVENVTAWSGKGSDTFATTAKAFGFCDVLGIDELDYDADGLGAGIRGDARVLNEQRKRKIEANAWRGSGKVVEPDEPIETTAPRNIAPDPDDVERLNGDYYANAKAQGWFSLRYRCQRTHRAVAMAKAGEDWRAAYHADDLISFNSKMPALGQLTAELSQATFTQSTAGKMLVDKTPDGLRSPNYADAAMIRFAPREPGSTYNLAAWKS
jgi:phage terminase large subunit